MTDKTSRTPDRAAAGDQKQLIRVADDLLPRIISHFTSSRLGELEIRQGDWRVRLRRAVDGGSPQVQERPAEGRRAVGPGGPAVTATAPEADPAHVVVTSPAVGYYQPADGRDLGRAIRSGDTLGHVDMLGVRHDIVSTADGVIGRLLAEPGQAVEYGQGLVRLDRMDLASAAAEPSGAAEPTAAAEPKA